MGRTDKYKKLAMKGLDNLLELQKITGASVMKKNISLNDGTDISLLINPVIKRASITAPPEGEKIVSEEARRGEMILPPAITMEEQRLKREIQSVYDYTDVNVRYETKEILQYRKVTEPHKYIPKYERQKAPKFFQLLKKLQEELSKKDIESNVITTIDYIPAFIVYAPNSDSKRILPQGILRCEESDFEPPYTYVPMSATTEEQEKNGYKLIFLTEKFKAGYQPELYGPVNSSPENNYAGLYGNWSKLDIDLDLIIGNPGRVIIDPNEPVEEGADIWGQIENLTEYTSIGRDEVPVYHSSESTDFEKHLDVIYDYYVSKMFDIYGLDLNPNSPTYGQEIFRGHGPAYSPEWQQLDGITRLELAPLGYEVYRHEDLYLGGYSEQDYIKILGNVIESSSNNYHSWQPDTLKRIYWEIGGRTWDTVDIYTIINGEKVMTGHNIAGKLYLETEQIFPYIEDTLGFTPDANTIGLHINDPVVRVDGENSFMPIPPIYATYETETLLGFSLELEKWEISGETIFVWYGSAMTYKPEKYIYLKQRQPQNKADMYIQKTSYWLVNNRDYFDVVTDNSDFNSTIYHGFDCQTPTMIVYNPDIETNSEEIFVYGNYYGYELKPENIDPAEDFDPIYLLGAILNYDEINEAYKGLYFDSSGIRFLYKVMKEEEGKNIIAEKTFQGYRTHFSWQGEFDDWYHCHKIPNEDDDIDVSLGELPKEYFCNGEVLMVRRAYTTPFPPELHKKYLESRNIVVPVGGTQVDFEFDPNPYKRR